MSEYINKLIGVGPAFPFNPTPTHRVSSSGSIDRINQSLFILFETRKGSRLMLPTFGSDLYKYRFDPLDNVLIERMRQTIKEDIETWEPRLIIDDIKFKSTTEDIDNSILYIDIYYHIINTDVKGNYVYPYKREARGTDRDETYGM